MHSWSRRLQECRRNLGSRTDEFWRRERAQLAIGHDPPTGLPAPIARLWRDQERLYARGEVRLAVVIAADSRLRIRARVGALALVVHGASRELDHDPEVLLSIAESLRDRFREPGEDEPFFARVPEATEAVAWIPVPSTIRGAHECHLTSMFVDRAALPDGWLAGEVFPVLALPEETRALTVLSWRYWPEEWVRAWRAHDPDTPPDSPEVLVIPGYGWPVPVLGMAGILAARAVSWLHGGSVQDEPDFGVGSAVALTLMGAALLAFERYERRAHAARWFDAADGHPLDVRFDRRFLFLLPRTWAWIAFAGAAVSVVKALR